MTNFEQVERVYFDNFARRKALLTDLINWTARRKRLVPIVIGMALLFAGLIYFARPNLMTPSPLGEITLGNLDAPITII